MEKFMNSSNTYNF